MRVRVLAVLDWLAHLAYVPLLLGRRHGVDGWRWHVHLIPGAWLEYVCDRYDLALDVTESEPGRVPCEP